MATSFLVLRCRRPATVGMFADLGVPAISWTVVDEQFGQLQVDCPTDLTPAQIQRARIRFQTWDAGEETKMVAAVNARDDLTAYIASTPSQAQAIAQVKLHATYLKALIEWAGKDALT